MINARFGQASCKGGPHTDGDSRSNCYPVFQTGAKSYKAVVAYYCAAADHHAGCNEGVPAYAAVMLHNGSVIDDCLLAYDGTVYYGPIENRGPVSNDGSRCNNGCGSNDGLKPGTKAFI